MEYSTDLNDLPSYLDLCLISTTADVRLKIVKHIISQSKVDYWILEKVLAQCLTQLDEFENCLHDAEGVWVNKARRMINWHQCIRETLPKREYWKIYGNGGNWGLACNAIHFIDLVSWWTGESLVTIDNSGLEDWFSSKREGFYEVTGKLVANYSKGSELILIANKKLNKPFTLHLQNTQGRWLLDETKGTFWTKWD